MESNPSPIPSPHTNETNINNNNNNRGGVGVGIGIGVVQIQTTSNPVIPSPRSDSTTFVQADTSNFKQVVQMLTGSSETTAKQQQQQQTIGSSSSPSTKLDHHNHHHRNFPIPPIKTFPSKRQPQQQGIISNNNNKTNNFRLYERRNLMINTLLPGFVNNNHNNHRLVSGFSPKGGGAEIVSPSMLNFPRLKLSPVTPLTEEEDPFNSLGSSSNSSLEEERAIAEKGFYLHPSPRSNTPRDAGGAPQLLTLFPLTSPRASESAS